MANYLLKFGDYVLPSPLLPVDDTGGQDAQEQALPRRAGAIIQAPRRVASVLPVRGMFHGQDFDAYFAVKRAILSNCLNRMADLWYGADDRYYKSVYLADYGFGDPAEGRLIGSLGTVTLTFRAAEYPEPFGTTTHSPALSTSGGTVNYSQGTATTLPVWTITFGSGANDGTLTLSNTTTGEACIIKRLGGFAPGSTLVLYRDGSYATLNGVASVGLFDRRIPTLRPGNNTITATVTGNLTVTGLAATYVPRFAS